MSSDVVVDCQTPQDPVMPPDPGKLKDGEHVTMRPLRSLFSVRAIIEKGILPQVAKIIPE